MLTRCILYTYRGMNKFTRQLLRWKQHVYFHTTCLKWIHPLLQNSRNIDIHIRTKPPLYLHVANTRAHARNIMSRNVKVVWYLITVPKRSLHFRTEWYAAEVGLDRKSNTHHQLLLLLWLHRRSLRAYEPIFPVFECWGVLGTCTYA